MSIDERIAVAVAKEGTRLQNPPKLQPLATLNQATPTPGDKYTVLDTTPGVRIYSIMAKDTWTVQPTPLEIHLTIDGQAWKFSQANPVSATKYFCMIDGGNAITSQYMTATVHPGGRVSYLLEGRSVKIEAEITGGTSDPLEAAVLYAKYE